MGVAGAGKSTVGALLAAALGWRFHDGDDLHPAANRRKMASGQPLDDGDRRPWLGRIARVIARHARRGEPAVVACSALKRSYREVLAAATPGVRFVYLKGSPELIAERLRRRRGHFLPPRLLASQFEALEEPDDAVVVDVAAEPEILVAAIVRELGFVPATRDVEER